MGERDIPLVDLNTFKISSYDYTHSNRGDDYLPLIRRVVNYNPIILATPTYWYTMSAQMKTFIDRLSDLLGIGKEIGRELRGKSLYVITTYDTSRPEGFEYPFKETCAYMGLNYLGTSFIYHGEDEALKNRNDEELRKALQAVFSFPGQVRG